MRCSGEVGESEELGLQDGEAVFADVADARARLGGNGLLCGLQRFGVITAALLQHLLRRCHLLASRRV